jgi:uncharacterized protein Veg
VAAFARFLASELPKAVGLNSANGRRKSDGRAGHLCHGPYITLGPGRYTAGFYIRRDPGDQEGEVEIEVCAEHGRRLFANRTTPVRDLFASVDGLVHLDFTIDAVERGCELRLHVSARTQIEVSQAVLFRRDLGDRCVG